MYEFRIFSNHKATWSSQPGHPENVRKAEQQVTGSARAASILAMAILTSTITIGFSGCGSEAKAFSTKSSGSSTGLAVNPSSVDFGNVDVGKSASQKISITNEDKAPLKIALSTSNSAFTVDGAPVSTSLSGGSSMSVQVHYKPGSATDTTAQLSVDATTNTALTTSSTIKLHGKGSKTASLSGLSCASSSMIGAGADTCTVTLSAAAPSTGLAVTLASSSSVVTVPSSVTVASGATKASFSANISAVTATQTVTLIATQGSVSKTTSIKVSGATSTISPTISAISCGSSTFTGASSTTCSVSLSSPATSGGIGVVLASNNGAVAVPGSVNVAYGASSASFTATVSAVTTSQTAQVTASANSSSKSFAIQLNAATPALSLSASSLSFGNVAVGTSVSKSVTVTSSGSVAVTINSDSVTGTGFSVAGGGFPVTLNPGQAAVLTVQYAPTTASSVTGQLTLSSTAPSATVSLSGTGTTVTPTVSAVNCSSTSITGSLADSCSVNLSGSAPSGGVTVTLGSSSSAVAVPASVTVPATATSAAFTANVSPVTTAQSASLTATTGSTSKSVSLQLNAAIPTLSVNASSISFGGIMVNNATTQTVTLTSSGTAAVTVNSIAVTGGGFSAQALSLPAKLNPGQSLNVTLTFSPTTTGSFTGQLTINSNSSSNPTLVIGLSGTATSATYQVNLAWLAPSSSTMTISGYRVYRAQGGTNSWASLNSVSSQTTYTDTGVQSGQSYNYYVTSVDSSGSESSPSNTTTVTIP